MDADGQALVRELATILGPGKPPTGVGEVEFWIGRVGQALGAREDENDRLRNRIAFMEQHLREVKALMPAIEANVRGVYENVAHALDDMPPANTAAAVAAHATSRAKYPPPCRVPPLGLR